MTDERIIESPAPPESPVPVDTGFHRPVLLKAVVDAARGARRAVDGTLGDGGHAEALREAGIELLAIDRDPDAIRIGRARLGDAGIRYLNAPFASEEALAEIHDFEPDFILLDLGVSSRQLDEEGRGFTFRPGAPLDMRMGADGPTAADLLNTVAKDTLRAWLADWADERRAHRLAGEIVRRREHGVFAVSDDLVNAIRGVLGPRSGPEDFARIFQALRIAVNQELDGLVEALPALRDALAPGEASRSSVIIRVKTEWSSTPSTSGAAPASARPSNPSAPVAAARSAWPRPGAAWFPIRWKSPTTRAPGVPGSGFSGPRMTLRGRHWLVLWLLLFLGVAAAVVTRQREALLVAQHLSELKDRKTELLGAKADLERQIKLATSRAVLVPKMEKAGLHRPTDLENTYLKVDSLSTGAARPR